MKHLLGTLMVLGISGCGMDTGPETRRAVPAVVIPDAGAINKLITREQRAAGELVTNSVGMVLVPIPVGEFQMGSPGSELDREEDETQHWVKISKPFSLGAYEVTQEQYKSVMGTNPSRVKNPQNPVEEVNWDEAVEFCRRLTDLAEEKRERRIYRLPTEAEWEYACRAGATTAFSFGGDASQFDGHGWFVRNSKGRAHPVGQKQANAWGLYDMHGNVWEWCQDLYGKFETAGVVRDPIGRPKGSVRVNLNRGGSWRTPSENCRAARRNDHLPGFRCLNLGFRVALSPSGARGEKQRIRSGVESGS